MRRIVIIGGGAIGSSIAFHLAANSRFHGDIIVVERDPGYRIASSSLSASSIRQQFSTPINIAMSQFGSAFLREAQATLAVKGEGPALALRTPGYLFLASASGAGVLRQNHETQRQAGADIALLDPAGIVARFPWMSTTGIAAGALGRSGEGWFDGPALLVAYRRKAISLGVRYIDQDATGFDREAARIRGIKLADGSVIACDIAVNAAGPWAARVAAWAGIDLPVRARKRMVFVIACRQKLEKSPLVIDPTGIFFRPEGDRFITGRSPGDGEEDPDEPPLETDETMFNERIWPILAERVPAFAAVKVTSAWAGYYELNLFDHNGIVGPHPSIDNLIFANGFSGHGMQHSPAIGRGVAELIAEGRFTSLDLSPLAFTRIVENKPLIESNIV